MPVRPRARFARPRRSPSAVLRKGWHERKDRHRCAITSMALGPRGRAAAAPRRGRLRGSRPYVATTLRCAVRGRTAELAARPAAALLGHAAVSRKGGRAGARRARGLVLLATASYAGPGGAQPPLAVTTSTGQTNRPLPYCGPAIRNAAISCLPWHGVSREIRVPCTGSGPIRGRGEQRRRRGGARSRATSSDSRPLSERSVPAGREVSGPCAPARAAQRSRPAGPTAPPGRNRCRAPGSRARHSSHGSAVHGRHAPIRAKRFRSKQSEALH